MQYNYFIFSELLSHPYFAGIDCMRIMRYGLGPEPDPTGTSTVSVDAGVRYWINKMNGKLPGTFADFGIEGELDRTVFVDENGAIDPERLEKAENGFLPFINV